MSLLSLAYSLDLKMFSLKEIYTCFQTSPNKIKYKEK